MRRITLLALFSAAACASGGGDPTRAPFSGPATVQATGDGVHVQLSTDAVASSHTVAASADGAWRALPQVYADLGWPAAQDERTHSVRAARVVLTRRSLGAPVSRFLNCGITSVGQSAADTHRVEVTLATSVAPAGGGTEVKTLVQGFARAQDGSSGSEVRCVSTGLLEKEIADRVQRMAAG